MNRKVQHVVPAMGKGWNIVKGGASRATKHFSTKENAIEAAKKICRNQAATLVVHKSNGRIQRVDSTLATLATKKH